MGIKPNDEFLRVSLFKAKDLLNTPVTFNRIMERQSFLENIFQEGQKVDELVDLN